MTILVITDKRFANLANGYDMRVWNLCRELGKLDRMALVSLSCDERDRGEANLDPRELFADVAEPLVLVNGHASIMRHFRLSEAYYYPRAYPAYHRQASALIDAMLHRHGATRIVAFGHPLAGLLEPFRSKKIVMDICDSYALHFDRYAAACVDTPVLERLRWEIWRRRWVRSEANLPRWFTHVIATTDADAASVRKVSGGCTNVTTISNGVDRALEQEPPAGDGPARRGVVFWGDLSYSANEHAIRHFYEKVYQPHLAARGVEWCVIGRNAPSWLQEAARQHPSIKPLGYVADLYRAVAQYPVVINPMVSGSGVKNKMLEALALAKPVVSTPLGMESITGAVDGSHYVGAATPEAMAQAILALLEDPGRRAALGVKARELILSRHTWSHVGEKLRTLVASM